MDKTYVGTDGPRDGSEYIVVINGVMTRGINTFGEAIKLWTTTSWDLTYKQNTPVISGEIMVKMWRNGLCVRHGNLMHLNADGHLFLSSSLNHD